MMNEAVFVLKCLAITAAIVLFSQTNLGGLTIENHVDGALRTSKASVWIQSAAAGGALVISNAARSVKETVTGGFQNAAHATRAGRWN